jgi:hypothetical protein
LGDDQPHGMPPRLKQVGHERMLLKTCFERFHGSLNDPGHHLQLFEDFDLRCYLFQQR